MLNSARRASLQHATLQPVWILPHFQWARQRTTRGGGWQSTERCSKPDEHENWFIFVKPLFMLSSASQIFIWRWQPGQSITRDNCVISWFLPHSETSAWGSYSKLPSRLRVILEIQFLSLLYAVYPPVSLSCPLSKERQPSKHLFLLLCCVSIH